MASPQTENGYTKIANELLDALCGVQLSGHEWKIVHTVIRKTYGYNKKEDWIAGVQITQLTSLPKQRVNEAKKKLLSKKILVQKGRQIALNKDYESWVESNGKTLLGNGKALPKVTENRPHKRKKETITKETTPPSGEDLKDNEKDMSGFNKISDDYLEAEVQVDPDYKPKGKKESKKVADDIQAVFDLFSNPAKVTWRMREIERVSAQALFDTYGIETLKKRINRIEAEKKQNPDDPFFPLVNTPSQLLDKMENVERYIKQTS